MRRTAARGWMGLAGAVAATGLVLSACSGGGGADAPADRDTVSMALPVGSGPNWIMPIAKPDTMATYNNSIKSLLFVPLFNFNGTSGTVEWDEKSSAASAYEFSADHKSVTITLADLDWSDGTPVTTRDVEFWYNLVRFNAPKTGGYSPGTMPDNIEKFETVDDKTFTLTFDRVYNEDYLLANQLTLMRPMPQHVWDKTSDEGEIGDFDRDEKDAAKVLDYLFSEAEDISGYAENPLWATVNGPYGLESWSDAGKVTLSANEKYTGEDAASIPTVELMPFTSADAEMNAVRAGEVDYGFITASQLENEAQFTDLGYDIDPWDGWSITYMPYNFKNPEMGPVFEQLYVRQALQHSVDQESLSEIVWHGAAKPGYGPVPQNPETEYLSEDQKANPYAFDLEEAKKLFSDHGWTPAADGVLECTDPGDGDDQCGDGVEEGQRMEMTFTVQNGSQETDNMMAEIQSAFSQVGVEVHVDSKPLDNVLTEAQTCVEGSSCDWQLTFFGTAGSWYFPSYPTGEKIFAKDAKWNAGQYDNPQAEELIQDMTYSPDPEAATDYSTYLAEDLPVMWLPNPVYQVSVVKRALTVGEQDPGAGFFPQRWAWK